MADEPDSTSRRRPPTIELKATEVETEKPAQEPGAATAAADGVKDGAGTSERASWNSGGSLKIYAVGAVAGAIVMAAIIAGLWVAGVVPAQNSAAAPKAQPAASDEISAQLNKIEAALAARRPEAAVAERLATAEAQTKSLGDSLAALNRRVDEVAGAAQSALARANAASTAADGAKSAAQGGVQRSDLDALTNRIAALERTVKALSDDVTRRASSADDKLARLFVVADGAARRSRTRRAIPGRTDGVEITRRRANDDRAARTLCRQRRAERRGARARTLDSHAGIAASVRPAAERKLLFGPAGEQRAKACPRHPGRRASGR